MILQAPPPAAQTVIVNPDWLRHPDTDQMRAVWPADAARRGVSGKATLKCRVAVSGAAFACQVVSETPPGMGFGAAALLLAPNFAFKPRTVNGVPTASEIVLPIAFNAALMAGGGASGQQMRVLPWAPWSRTPSAEEVRAAYPAAALARKESGAAAFRCELAADAALRACLLTQESPEGQGFTAAGRKLLPRFRVLMSPEESRAALREFRVVVVTRFSAHAAGAAFDLTEPDWLVGADPQVALDAFPAEARAAHVTSGRAVLDCRTGEDGALQDCRTRNETPAGLGFGAAAAKVAAAMRVNGWTRDGERAAGAHVALPLRLVDAATPAVTGAAQKSPGG